MQLIFEQGTLLACGEHKQPTCPRGVDQKYSSKEQRHVAKNAPLSRLWFQAMIRYTFRKIDEKTQTHQPSKMREPMKTNYDLVTDCFTKIWMHYAPKRSVVLNLGKRQIKPVSSQNALTARSSQLENPETNIIQCLVVKHHTLISILNQLMNRKGSIVWFHDSIRNLRWWEHRESKHHSIRVFLSDLRNQ